MHPSAIARVRTSHAQLAPRADRLVERFYGSLFAQHPEIRALFPGDMARQKNHLIAALALVCKNLDCLDVLEEPLMDLGAQHVSYGTTPDHYPIIRDLLLDAIRQTAGEAWTPQLAADWFEALNAVCAAMLKGAARDAMSVAKTMAPLGRPQRPGQNPGQSARAS